MRRLSLFYGIIVSVLTALSSCETTNTERPSELEAPVVHITTQGASLSIDPAGGSGMIKYEIVNPQGLDSVVISLDEKVDWITNIKHEKFQTSGRFSFDAPRNMSNEIRTAIFTITYFYSENESTYAIASVDQSYEIFDYNFSGKAGICRYWGRGIATYDYEVILGDVDYTLGTPGATYYTINFCDSVETEDRRPRAGEYGFPEESNMSAGRHIFTGYCSYYKLDASGQYVDGEPLQIWDGKDFFVEKDGDVYTIYGDLFDQNGKHHRIYYIGKLDVYDGTILSDFKEDVTLDFSDMHIEATVSELYGWSNWCSMYVVPNNPEEGDFIIRAELYLEAGVFELQSGSFPHDDIGMCDPFFFNGGHLWERQKMNGTWLFSCTNVQSDGMYDFGRPRAPFVNGVIDVEVCGNGNVNLAVDVVDSQGNNFSGKGDNLTVTYF